MKFRIQSLFQPSGDQPEAIAEICQNLEHGVSDQVLLGVTGSGKTFTVANVIQKIQKPTLVIAHNKTLAAQLYSEFREFFPSNAVCYFISYYDYYQPEAYIPRTDTYIEKEVEINEEIDKLRLAATTALLTRKDVIVVASVSCIYGLGSPKVFKQAALTIKKGSEISQFQLFRQLTDLQYVRNDTDLRRGTFRVRGDTVDIFPAYGDEVYRLEFFANNLETITRRQPITLTVMETTDSLSLFPAKHYLTESNQEDVLRAIEKDLAFEVKDLESAGKTLEAHRLKQKTNYDHEMIRNTGRTPGIENYSRYFDRREPGSAPYTLLDFFKANGDFLVVIDESHMTIPQIRGMYNGDQARKTTLIDYGFRLKAARDNRPLKFTEFLARTNQKIYLSATPSEWEVERSKKMIVEQLVRPTGILDPQIEIRPTEKQIDNLVLEIKKRTEIGQRTIVTTLTKRMAEDLTDFLLDLGIKVQYLHSEIVTIKRSEILRSLRLGEYDVIVGINLLREGLDLPEVSLVAILDADKEGFLRSESALVQTFGRAARHLDGQVIMYADRLTGSMERAVSETKRRRKIQEEFNQKHQIKPVQIVKTIKELDLPTKEQSAKNQVDSWKKLPTRDRVVIIEDLRFQMQIAAENLDFEQAAVLRDQIKELQTRSQ